MQYKVAWFLLLCSCSTTPPSTSLPRYFSMEKISEPSRETSRELSQEETQIVEKALSQDYHYFGCGGQSYIFFSRDEKYVLKFLKPKFSKVPEWIKAFPLPFLVQGIKKKKETKGEIKKNKVLSAFELCFQHLTEETGVLYAHLSSDFPQKTVRLLGPEGTSLELDLNDPIFLLQKRATLAYDQIDDWMGQGRKDLAKQGIEQLLLLHMDLLKKGFRNRDANFKSNCGFIEGKPILFDIGRVVYSEEIKKEEHYKKEMERITPRFRKWIASHHEELLEHFDQTTHSLE